MSITTDDSQGRIPQTDPGASYLAYRAEIDLAVSQTLERGWYILGREVERFEKEFASFLGVSHAVGVASGTDALQLALRTCNIGFGDVVITVSHTAVATVAAIELTGAMAATIDIDPATYTIDPNQLDRAINSLPFSLKDRLKAIIPVHLYGNPVDMQAITEIGRANGLYVIEDCAQSHGAGLNGRMTGTWGNCGAFSFYPTKNLGCFGDGGAIVTDDSALAEKTRRLRQYGWHDRYISDEPGMNSRLDELQAAVLRVKLRHLDQDNQKRRTIAALYDRLLSGTALKLPSTSSGSKHVYHQYVVRVADRDGLRNFLDTKGIDTAIHYPRPVHLQPAYKGRVTPHGMPLLHTERACGEILSLPIYPQMKEEDVILVSSAIKEWCDTHEEYTR